MTKSMDLKVRKVAAYIAGKYDASRLSQYQTCNELLFRGKELSKVLGTAQLPSLNVRDVACYIVLHT